MTRRKAHRGLWIAALLFLVQGAGEPATAQPTDPILTVETGMHTARLWRMTVDASDRFLVTAAEDKTARIWDISGKERPVLVRTLRPPIGLGPEGRLLGAAISPDGSSVACGGVTGKEWHGHYAIYLFDRASGRLVRSITGVPSVIHHLAYSRDGRFLVATLSRGVRLYRASDLSLLAEDKDYKEPSTAAAFDPGASLLATVSLDGHVRLYSLTGLDGKAHGPIQMAPVAKVRPLADTRTVGVAFSPDGAFLAVGFAQTPRVDVFETRDNSLRHAFSPDTGGIQGKADVAKVAWSLDGKSLYAGGSYGVKGTRYIRKWSKGGRGGHTDLPAGNVNVSNLLSLAKGGVAYCAVDPPAFGIYDERDQLRFSWEASVVDHRGNQEDFCISADGWTVQFGWEAGAKALGVLSMRDRSLTDISQSLFGGIKAAFTLKAPSTTGLDIRDWKGSRSPKLGDNPLPLLPNESSVSVAVAPEKDAFVLGSDQSLRWFDRTGKQLWRVSAPGVAHCVNTNGRLVVAAFGDGTIRWFRPSDGKEILAFFPHKDRKRWVLWTPSGYYEASPGAEDLIGWHVNNGKDREADFFPASRFRSTFQRPDVIDKVVATLDEAEAVRLANEESGRKPAAAVSVREKLPPVVTIASPSEGSEVSGSPVSVRYTARSQDPVMGVKVLVDGRPVAAEGDVKPVRDGGELRVPVPPRDCEISIIAENQHAPSEPATIRLRWKGAPPPKEEFQIKPKLYVLAVGVSAYKDADMRLGLAAKDALDFGAAWAEQKKTLYSGVEVRTLTDAQATKGKILDGLEWVQRQATQKDVAVLFFAGHGINDPNGMFYFLPVDAELDYLKRTGISQSDITSTVAAIAGKVLVFMDACHSGNLMGKVKRRAVVDIGAVINELASAENGAVVFSSATGRQYSLENPGWGNGAFTKGLVEGIRGKADFRGTGRITVNMLDLYVSERVKELTEGKQTPTTVKPPNVPDFPVVVLRP